MSPLRPGGPGLERRSASPIGHKAMLSMETAVKRCEVNEFSGVKLRKRSIERLRRWPEGLH